MKRGFLNSNRNAHKEVGPGNGRLNQPIVNDGENLLGSEPGVPETIPKFEVGKTPSSGLSWAPVSDSLRDRWSAKPTTPWKYAENNQNDVCMDDEDTIATGSTYPSSVEASVASSLATQPVLPHGKMIEAPKAALYDWYLKEHKTQVVGKECYFTWHNERLPHERMFTSIFVCPVTGEMFATGKYGPRTGIKKRIDSLTRETIEETRVYYEEQPDELTGAQVVWFTDKTSSQHGAAARAYDCFSYRKYKPRGMRSVHLGDEEPYMTEQEAPPLPTIPGDVRNKVDAQLRRIATLRTQAASIHAPSQVAPKAALSAWYGIKPRSHQLSKNSFVTWNDHSMPHLLKYTSVFVCPLSREVFWSGRHGSAASYEEGIDVQGRPIIWYNKKALAEHAAAARAYDCWCFRLEGRESGFLGHDKPYRSAKDAPVCHAFPMEVKQRISELQQEAKARMPVPVILKPAPPMQSEEETLKDRDEYRAARAAQN